MQYIYIHICLLNIFQPESYGDALDIINIVFTTIFTLEAIVKIIGLRWHYFRRAWNVFDFIIVLLSITGISIINTCIYIYINYIFSIIII